MLGSDNPRVFFGEAPKAAEQWAGKRLLSVDDRPAFELSFWCGTCQFLFERLEGANETLSLAATQEVLRNGIDDIDDDIVGAFSELLQRGEYLPMLIEFVPELTEPAAAADYFAHEQVDTWGKEPFWDLPISPHSPYYRTFATSVDDEAHLYEFVVPMVPPSWNDRTTIADYAASMTSGEVPTAVAVSTLDVCAPADGRPGLDWYWHWGLTHFLLDGHHKLEAAAQIGAPVRLLSLISIDNSLASREQVQRVPRLRGQVLSQR